MDIHGQAGIIEQPLASLGEQLPEASKKALEKTVEQVVAQAPYARRAGWWIKANPIIAALSAVALGIVAVVTLRSMRE